MLLKKLLCSSLFLVLFSSCTKKLPMQTQQVLGTVCSINLYSDGTKNLYDCVFNRLFELDSKFNVNKLDSDVSKINIASGTGEWVTVSDDVLYVLNRAIYFAELSNGAFDPTVGSLVKLWGINTEHQKVPLQEEIDVALSLIDFKKIEIDKNKVRLTKKGMMLDLGGIAKGFAADEVVKILESKKVKRAIINLGGNIYVYGKKKDGTNWNVGVKNPLNPEAEPLLLLSFANSNSVVTSGVYERYFERNGNRYHHIFDVKTGKPFDTDCLSSTIVSTCSLDADALSTIAFLLGKEKYFLLSEHKSAIFIYKDKSVVASKELQSVLSAYSKDNIMFEYK